MEVEKRKESEIDFKDVIKNPIRLFGASYIYFFVVILIIGIYYVKNLDTVSFNTVPVSYIDSLNIDRDIPQKRGGLMPAVNLDEVKNPPEEMIAKGKELFNANCLSCHGSEGKGDGPAGAALNPAPRNFLLNDEWTNGRTLFDMYKTLQEGIIQNGMAAYEYLSPEDRIAMIHYIRTFGEFPEITDDEILLKLDFTYNLSSGSLVPNQIPVKKAASIITEEFTEDVENSDVMGFINESKSKPGARILIDNSRDPQKVIFSTYREGIADNLTDFVKSVSANPIVLGYRTSVVYLTENEWETMHKFLIEVTKLN